MTNFIIRRLIASVFLAFALVAVIFFMLRTVVPGDPALVMAGERASVETIAAIRKSQGLDKPLLEQFWIFLQHIFEGDLGTSTQSRMPVLDRLLDALPITVRLTIACFIFTMITGIFVGIVTAYWHDTWLDNLMRVVTVASASMPTFWLGLLLILLFAVNLGWLPVQGNKDSWNAYVLPTLTLSVGASAFLARLVRAAMLEVLNSDYIRTARAKGVVERWVVLKHALRNALIPIITVAGFEVGGLLGGAVISEAIFGLPGMGNLSINAIHNRDYPVIQGTTLFICTAYLFVNLLVDIAYAYVDPRIRYD